MWIDAFNLRLTNLRAWKQELKVSRKPRSPVHLSFLSLLPPLLLLQLLSAKLGLSVQLPLTGLTHHSLCNVDWLHNAD